MKVAALVLAAEEASVFAGPNQLVEWGDSTLLGHVLDQVSSWPVDEVWVVLGANADEILEVVDFGDATVVVDESHLDGMSSSLKVGIDAIMHGTRVDAILIVPADQPGIPDEVPAALIDAMVENPAQAVVPKYRYDRGNPVLVARWLWERLMSLEGDESASALLATHPEWVHEVWFNVLPPRSIDTVEAHDDLRPKRH